VTDRSNFNLGILRDFNGEEVELALSWRNSPGVRLNMYTTHEISIEEHLKWWGKISKRHDQKYFIYEYKSAPMGVVSFNGIDLKNRRSSWAFYASPQAPRGTGSRMEFLALEYAFNNLVLHKLECEVLSFNEAVLKMHQKFGFRVEGLFRDQQLRGDKFFDVYRLGLLESEWREIRDTLTSRIQKIY
jgi:UDP-4-amino-4,6-dideoxy-N-acetyl-beta-L-altrosamine N-acetyltransferase